MTRLLVILLLLLSPALPAAAQSASGDPVRGFFSVEAYEIRLEALVRPAAFAENWDLSGTGIPRDHRQAILDRAISDLQQQVAALANSVPLSFGQARARFVVPDPELGYVDDERGEIPLAEALIGAHLSAGAELADRLEIEWNWFAPGQDRVAIEIAGPSRPAARYATREQPGVTWEAEQGQRAVEIELPQVEYRSKQPQRFGLIAGGLLLAVAIALLLAKRRNMRNFAAICAVLGAGKVGAAFYLGTIPVILPDREESAEICYALLRQTYHAFDYRSESDIYDTLALSVAGPLLEQVYLEVHQSLELGEQGGPRVKIIEIDLRKSDLLPGGGNSSDGAFLAGCEWATIGEVTHWGHTHERTNLYRARMQLAPVDGQWRILQLDLQEEERLQRVSRRLADDGSNDAAPDSPSTP